MRELQLLLHGGGGVDLVLVIVVDRDMREELELVVEALETVVHVRALLK